MVAAGKAVNVDDLLADPVVLFQDRHKQWVMPLCCFVLPSLLSMWVAGDSYWRGFFISGVLRYVLVLHATWLVNRCVLRERERAFPSSLSPLV